MAPVEHGPAPASYSLLRARWSAPPRKPTPQHPAVGGQVVVSQHPEPVLTLATHAEHEVARERVGLLEPLGELRGAPPPTRGDPGRPPSAGDSA